MKDHTVITGIGYINGHGAGNENFSRVLSSSGPQQPLEDIDLDAYVDTSLVRRADLVSKCALVSAKLALEDAGLYPLSKEESENVGAVIGTVHGSVNHTLEYHTSLVLGDPKLSSPLFFSESVPNSCASHISVILGIRGYTATLSGYCSTIQALRIGAELIENGSVDVCLVGGADVNNDFLQKAYGACVRDPGLITKNFGGSGSLILESSERAARRNAKVYARMDIAHTVTASYSTIKRGNISVLRELLDQTGEDLKENDRLLYACFDEEDCVRRNDLLIKDFAHPRRHLSDCGNILGRGFCAAEAFQLILGALGVYSSGNLSFLNGFSGFDGQLDRIFVSNTALSGANACALFSRHSPGIDRP